MTKILIMRPRNFRPRIEPDGTQTERPMWHDVFLLLNAIESIYAGLPMSKAAMWGNIAAKLQLAQEAEDDFAERLPEIQAEIRNKEAKVLWRELMKLKPEAFGRDRQGNPAAVSPVWLYRMLSDLAEQLGYEMPGDEGDESEEE